jgi:hypothetical protein
MFAQTLVCDPDYNFEEYLRQLREGVKSQSSAALVLFASDAVMYGDWSPGTLLHCIADACDRVLHGAVDPRIFIS